MFKITKQRSITQTPQSRENSRYYLDLKTPRYSVPRGPGPPPSLLNTAWSDGAVFNLEKSADRALCHHSVAILGKFGDTTRHRITVSGVSVCGVVGLTRNCHSTVDFGR